MKIFALFVVSLILVQAPVAYAQTSLPKLKVEGNLFKTPDSETVTLRGVSLCSLEWHKPLQQIQQVTQSPLKWNVNVLRLPVQVKEWERIGPQSYLKNNLDPAVRMCEKNNVYCIIDWHQIGQWDDPKVSRSLRDFWEHVAPRYAGKSNILYEVFNEPVSPAEMSKENWAAWKKSAQSWVNLIRVKAPETIILIGSPHWSQMPRFAVEDPFMGKNLAYVMHLYPNWKEPLWDMLFGDASKHVPIFMTEWGWSSTTKEKDVVFKGDLEIYGKPLRKYLEDKPSVSWTAWSYDPLCGPAMLGPDKDMAAFVKEWLADSNGQ